MGQRLEPRNPFRRDPFMPTSMPPYDLLCAHRCRSRPLESSKRIEIASSGPLAHKMKERKARVMVETRYREREAGNMPKRE